MTNISYLWQLLSSMQEAGGKLEKAVKSGRPSDVTKIKALLFELKQRVDEEVKEKNGK